MTALRTRSATVRLAAASAAAGLLLAAPASSAHAPGDPASARALSALTTRPATVAARQMPADLPARFGYRPRIEAGLLGNPDGDCSSPIPLPGAFEPACRQHDLAYDLIRRADAVGRPLPASARAAADRHLQETLHSACRTSPARLRCIGMAELAYRAVRANSVRQHDGVPGPETPRSVLALAGVAAAPVLLLSTVRRRRTDAGGRP